MRRIIRLAWSDAGSLFCPAPVPLSPVPDRLFAAHEDGEGLTEKRHVEQALEIRLRHDGEAPSEASKVSRCSMKQRENVRRRVLALTEIDDESDIASCDRGAEELCEIGGRAALQLDDDDRRRCARYMTRLDHDLSVPTSAGLESSSAIPSSRPWSRQITAPCSR